MPLFLFASGFLMIFTLKVRDSERYAWHVFVGEKFRRLIVPLLFLSAVAFIPRVYMSQMADEPVTFSLESLARSFFDSGALTIPYFWFLHALFLLLVITYGLVVLADRYEVSRGVALGAFAVFMFLLGYLPVGWPTLFSVNEVVRLGCFFVIGALFGEFSAVIDRYVCWHSWGLFGILLIGWATLFFLTDDTPWIVLCSLFGIAMCISFVKILEHYGSTVFDHLMGANYMIFLLSWFCNVATQQVLHHFVELPWWVFTLLSFFGGVYIPWACYRFLCAHAHEAWTRPVAFLLGQRFKSKASGKIS